MKDMYGRIMIDVEGTSLSQQDRELISNGNVGGIILFSKNFNSFEQISDLVNEIHAIKENILLAVDQEGGRVQRFSKDFTQLPSLQDLAKYSEINNDPDICKEVAWLTSSELIAAGIDLNFAPVLDIDESDSAIIGDRSFSSKTDEVIKHAEKYIEGMHEAGMQATAKHFPGHGSSTTDTHKEFTDVSDSWIVEELFPYHKLMLEDKVDGIMTSHVVNSKIDDSMLPATLSEKSINKLLREFLDYEGVVFSDDMQMGAITRNFGLKESVVYAINAGVDVLIFSNNQVYKDLVYPEEVINIIEEGVRNGEVSLLRINESFRRIQNLKKKINLIN